MLVDCRAFGIGVSRHLGRCKGVCKLYDVLVCLFFMICEIIVAVV